jgi:hypothetical protein
VAEKRAVRSGLGFALLFLAILLTGTPYAHGEGFEASSYPATVTGTSAKGALKLNTEGGSLECLNHFDGQLKEASTVLSLTILYTECKAFGSSEAVVNVEGCTYRLQATERVAENEHKAHLDLLCPSFQSIKVEAGTCSIQIPAQTGLTTVVATNNPYSSPKEAIELLPAVKGLTYVVTKDGTGCPFGGTGIKTGGEITSTAYIGLVAAEKGIWVDKIEFPPSDSETGTPAFNAVEYPTEVEGSSPRGAVVFKTEGGSVECDNEYEGAIAKAASKLSLAVSFTGCSAFGFVAATVDAEGCDLVLHATEQVTEDEYGGHVDVECPAGDSIKVNASNCGMEVRPQSGRTSISLVDDPSAGSREDIAFTLAAKNFNYKVTKDGFLCPFGGIGPKTGGELTSSTIGIDGLASGPSVDFSVDEGEGGKGGDFAAGTYPASLEGQSSKGNLRILTEGGVVECDNAFSGDLFEASTTVSLGIAFAGCGAFGFVEATVKPEGCTFDLHSTEEVAPGKTAAHADLACSLLRSIKIGAGTCSAEIKPQTGLTTVTATNLAGSPKTLALTFGIKGLAYSVTKDGFGCPFGGTGSKTTGEILSVESVALAARDADAIGLEP